MSKILKTVFTLLTISSMAFITNCSNLVEQTSSASGSSHNSGEDCLSCHTGGEAFDMTIGGTVYTDSTGATESTGVEVIGTKDGSEVFRLEVDKKGNFYTNQDITFPIQVELSTGQVMSASVSSGGCNSSGCHDGSSESVIYE